MRVLFYRHANRRYTERRTSGSWTFRSSLSTLQHTRRVSDIICALLLGAIRLSPYAIPSNCLCDWRARYVHPFSICFYERTRWLTIKMALKELILSETASIFEVLSWESINSFVWTPCLPLVLWHHSNLVRCDKNFLEEDYL